MIGIFWYLFETNLFFFQTFPGDGLGQVVRNVFDFDSYHADVQKLVLSTLRKHGIPVGLTLQDVKLTKE